MDDFLRLMSKMRVGPEIKRGVGWMREGAFDFLAFFGSFWGDAKKNRTFEVKLRFNFWSVFLLGLLFQHALGRRNFRFGMKGYPT